jgi:hypothetical protein
MWFRMLLMCSTPSLATTCKIYVPGSFFFSAWSFVQSIFVPCIIFATFLASILKKKESKAISVTGRGGL